MTGPGMEPLTDGRIVLRPYTPEDFTPLHEAARESVREVFPWLPWCHPAYSREDSRAWVLSRQEAWESGEHYSFAVVAAGDTHLLPGAAGPQPAAGEFLGGVGINQVNRLHSFANLGYWVRTSRTGQGIATAATRLAARFGIYHLGLRRMEIVVAVENRASQRVAEKAGARREGVLRQRLQVGARWYDAVIYSLIAEDLGGGWMG